jgi:hypothetical protein
MSDWYKIGKECFLILNSCWSVLWVFLVGDHAGVTWIFPLHIHYLHHLWLQLHLLELHPHWFLPLLSPPRLLHLGLLLSWVVALGPLHHWPITLSAQLDHLTPEGVKLVTLWPWVWLRESVLITWFLKDEIDLSFLFYLSLPTLTPLVVLYLHSHCLGLRKGL